MPIFTMDFNEFGSCIVHEMSNNISSRAYFCGDSILWTKTERYIGHDSIPNVVFPWNEPLPDVQLRWSAKKNGYVITNRNGIELSEESKNLYCETHPEMKKYI